MMQLQCRKQVITSISAEIWSQRLFFSSLEVTDISTRVVYSQQKIAQVQIDKEMLIPVRCVKSSV